MRSRSLGDQQMYLMRNLGRSDRVQSGSGWKREQMRPFRGVKVRTVVSWPDPGAGSGTVAVAYTVVTPVTDGPQRLPSSLTSISGLPDDCAFENRCFSYFNNEASSCVGCIVIGKNSQRPGSNKFNWKLFLLNNRWKTFKAAAIQFIPCINRAIDTKINTMTAK